MGSLDNDSLTQDFDLSHHINKKSKARHPSPLKDIIKYMGYEGMISFAGGLPHPSMFAFEDASFRARQPSGSSDLQTHTVTRDKGDVQAMGMLEALQYGAGTGDISLRKWVLDFTKQVYQPAREDFEILLNAGNTDGWNKVVGLLCEEGDMILCEEHTYPSAQALWVPLGCEAVPVRMDGEGMRADDLEKTLSSWDEEIRGKKKPHLLYLVPAGSNPAGTLMRAERKKQIYEVCVKHDVIICEDDPYCALQYEPYRLGQVFTPKGDQSISSKAYVESLAPSFLKYDYQGRVIRLDTFSKTLAPGNRLGYFVANPLFTERLLRATEVETQAPSGWSQVIVSNLLHSWGIDGYLIWLSNLRDQYRSRRDWMCDAISRNFVAKEEAKTGSLSVSSKRTGKKIFSFIPPRAGMFLWAKFYLHNSPQFESLRLRKDIEDPEQTFSDFVWNELAKALVLVTPGSYYTPWQGKDKKTTRSRGAEEGIGYFRLAFSLTSREEMEKGIERMAGVLEDCWA